MPNDIKGNLRFTAQTYRFRGEISHLLLNLKRHKTRYQKLNKCQEKRGNYRFSKKRGVRGEISARFNAWSSKIHTNHTLNVAKMSHLKLLALVAN